QKVILGVRPEHISDASAAVQNSNEIQRIESRVKVAEPTGPDTLVFIKLNGIKVTCRVHPDKAKAPGDIILLVLDLSKAILFDMETEQRLS
ncbi:MAG: TOBE domain-containing protein, partial [Desulfobacteraceae bacterium]